MEKVEEGVGKVDNLEEAPVSAASRYPPCTKETQGEWVRRRGWGRGKETKQPLREDKAKGELGETKNEVDEAECEPGGTKGEVAKADCELGETKGEQDKAEGEEGETKCEVGLEDKL